MKTGDKMTKKAVTGNIFLLLAAALWGLAFVAQSDGMNYLGPFAFTSARSFLGSAAMIPVCIFTMGKKKKTLSEKEYGNTVRATVKTELICGIVAFFAVGSQQIGLQYTSAGKSGFITAMYIVLVPVLGGIFLKNKTGASSWTGVILAVCGLYLLCVKEDFSVGKGDIFTLFCALVFAVQILVIDRNSDKIDGALMNLIQFAVVSVVSAPFYFALEEPVTLESLKGAWTAIVYTGVFSSGVAYLFQIIGQQYSDNPPVASLIMSMESVFAGFFGWLILHEGMSARELSGVALMLSAIVISQIPVKHFGKKSQNL